VAAVSQAEHAAFARRAIAAAGETVAPEVGVAALAAHGAKLAAGTATSAAPADLIAGGARPAAAAPKRARAASPPPPPPPPPPSSSSGGRGRNFATLAITQATTGAGTAASGGMVRGDSAVGRILGAGVLGLGVLLFGSMLTKKDFAINLGASAPAAKPPAAVPYKPVYTAANAGPSNPASAANAPPVGSNTHGPLVSG
jgi:hypothetical protein